MERRYDVWSSGTFLLGCCFSLCMVPRLTSFVAGFLFHRVFLDVIGRHHDFVYFSRLRVRVDFYLSALAKAESQLIRQVELENQRFQARNNFRRYLSLVKKKITPNARCRGRCCFCGSPLPCGGACALFAGARLDHRRGRRRARPTPGLILQDHAVDQFADNAFLFVVQPRDHIELQAQFVVRTALGIVEQQ